MADKHYHIDLGELRRLWEDNVPVLDIAARFGVTRSYIGHMRQWYDLPRREIGGVNVEPEAPSPEDEAASGDSLRLSPWVQARIKELGIGIPA